MSWLCYFFAHRWRFLFNAAGAINRPSMSLTSPLGVYQCERCRELSTGRTR